MSDIQPGDVVECIHDGPLNLAARFGGANWHGLPPEIKVGRLFRVAAVCPSRKTAFIGVRLREVNHRPNSLGCCIERFRKIEPGKLEFTGLTERVKEGEPA